MAISLEMNSESAITRISSRIETKTGDSFFRLLVSELAGLTDAEVVFISEITEPGEKAQTIAIHSAVGPAENFEYGIENSPSGPEETGVCILEEGVREKFPDDYLLADLSVEGYASVALMREAGIPTGFLVMLFQNPIPDIAVVRAAMEFFRVRTAVELEHRLSVKKLKETESYFRCLTDQLGDVIFVANLEYRIKYISAASEAIFGLFPDEMQGKNLLHYFTEDCVQLATQELEKMMATRVSLRGLTLRARGIAGQFRTIEINAVPSFRGNEMPEMVGVIREVIKQV
jgi:PAS domain S-box-containing protein